MELAGLNWPTAIISLMLMGASCTAFAMFVGNLAIVSRNFNYYLGSVSGAMLGLTGMVIPRGELPLFLGEVGAVLPITHSLEPSGRPSRATDWQRCGTIWASSCSSDSHTQ